MINKVFEVREDEDVGIILSDGCRLSARIWMPNINDFVLVHSNYIFLNYIVFGGELSKFQDNKE